MPKENDKPPKHSNSDGATIGEYKGHPILTLPCGDSGRGFSFGLAKAKAILEHIDSIRDFVENQ